MALDKDALKGRVALVTGASRGVGKGVALALGEAGATVYVTGRTRVEGGALSGTVGATAKAVSERGGVGVEVICDHSKDEEVRAAFERVRAEQGHLDILVNNVFSIPSGPLFNTPFWEQPIFMWDQMHTVGLRSHYVASVLAAPMMIERGGLIANISSFGGRSYQVNVAYGVGKAGVDRLAKDMARDLRARNVACVSLYPGIVRTERLEQMARQGTSPWDLENAESPLLTGRAVCALAADEAKMERTGRVLVVAELAAEYGFEGSEG